MILQAVFNPPDGTNLGSDIIYTEITKSISAELLCELEFESSGDGGYTKDPDPNVASCPANVDTPALATPLVEGEELSAPSGDCSSCIFIVNVDLSINISHSDITLTSGNPANFSGQFTLDPFDRTDISFVNKGSSTKLQEPVTVSKTSEVPPQRDIFRAIPDSRQSINAVITATATDNIGNTYTANYTYTLGNNSTLIAEWLKKYMKENE